MKGRMLDDAGGYGNAWNYKYDNKNTYEGESNLLLYSRLNSGFFKSLRYR